MEEKYGDQKKIAVRGYRYKHYRCNEVLLHAVPTVDQEKFGGQITEPELRQWARNRSLSDHTHSSSLAGCCVRAAPLQA